MAPKFSYISYDFLNFFNLYIYIFVYLIYIYIYMQLKAIVGIPIKRASLQEVATL